MIAATVRRVVPLVAVSMAVLTGGSATRAGTVFYSSDFNTISGWYGQMDPANGSGGTIQTATSSTPFVVGGASMGPYILSTFYPTTLVAPAFATTTPEVWIGFLVRNESGAPWITGVSVDSGTNNQQVQYDGPWVGGIGSAAGTLQMTLTNGPYTSYAPNSYQLVTGSAIAVLSRFYDSNNSGIYDTADLWVQSNLSAPLFQTLTSSNALNYGFSLGGGDIGAIRSLRLGGGEGGEQAFDNLVMASTSADAIAFLSTGVGVPEIDPAGLGGVAALVTGALGLIERRRPKAKSA